MTGRGWRSAARLLLGLTLALPWAARAESGGECPAGTIPVRVDARSCPSLPRQLATVVRRTCCERKDGRISCRQFPPCPMRSPS